MSHRSHLLGTQVNNLRVTTFRVERKGNTVPFLSGWLLTGVQKDGWNSFVSTSRSLFQIGQSHRRDEDPRMSLPCYKNSLQICSSVQGLCLSLYYHFWFQVRHAENLGINTPVITTGKIWTSRKSVLFFFFFFLLGPLECWSCKSNCHTEHGQTGLLREPWAGRNIPAEMWWVAGGWVQTSVRARNSWAPVLGGPKSFLAFAARKSTRFSQWRSKKDSRWLWKE